MGLLVLLVGVIGITSWMQTTRIGRGQVLAVRAREYVSAAREHRCPPHAHHPPPLVPQTPSPFVVTATLDIVAAIITESVLSFPGLGFP